MYQPPLPPPQDFPAQPPPPPPPPECEEISPPGVLDIPTPNATDAVSAAAFNYTQHPPPTMNTSYSTQSSSSNYFKYGGTAYPSYEESGPSQSFPTNSSSYSYENYPYQEAYAAQPDYGHQPGSSYNYEPYGQNAYQYKYQERERYEYTPNYRPPNQRYVNYNHNNYQNNYGGYGGHSNRYEQRYNNPRHPRAQSYYPFGRSNSKGMTSDDSRSYRERSESAPNLPKMETERDRLLRQWCANYCEKPEDYIKNDCIK